MDNIGNFIRCPARMHRRHTVLCPRCAVYRETGCTVFYKNESRLRRARHRVAMELNGLVQRRLFFTGKMQIDPNEIVFDE